MVNWAILKILTINVLVCWIVLIGSCVALGEIDVIASFVNQSSLPDRQQNYLF